MSKVKEVTLLNGLHIYNLYVYFFIVIFLPVIGPLGLLAMKKLEVDRYYYIITHYITYTYPKSPSMMTADQLPYVFCASARSHWAVGLPKSISPPSGPLRGLCKWEYICNSD